MRDGRGLEWLAELDQALAVGLQRGDGGFEFDHGAEDYVGLTLLRRSIGSIKRPR